MNYVYLTLRDPDIAVTEFVLLLKPCCRRPLKNMLKIEHFYVLV
uniref:Uncharacterized protein n=1 Tax=Anguilla anguilla TaxID=7936 RepID=A0A0E9R0R1_ANGAN